VLGVIWTNQRDRAQFRYLGALGSGVRPPDFVRCLNAPTGLGQAFLATSSCFLIQEAPAIGAAGSHSDPGRLRLGGLLMSVEDCFHKSCALPVLWDGFGSHARIGSRPRRRSAAPFEPIALNRKKIGWEQSSRSARTSRT
jgi:hypothetical protein